MKSLKQYHKYQPGEGLEVHFIRDGRVAILANINEEILDEKVMVTIMEHGLKQLDKDKERRSIINKE